MDVTATRKAQEALHVAQTELAHVTRMTTLGEMSASIAHEVNQPLAAIVTNGEAGLRWLDREVPEIAEALDAIRQIVGEAHRASGVIRGIREFSRKAAPEMVHLDINDVIEEAIALVRHEALRHGVAIRPQLAPAMPMVRGDRIQLQQVIINLVINALQAMATITDRERVLFIRTQRQVRPGAGGGGGRRRRNRAGERGPAFQRVLHHEAGRPGHGIVHLSLDHRRSRRTGVGFPQYRPGDDIPVYDFSGGTRRKEMKPPAADSRLHDPPIVGNGRRPRITPPVGSPRCGRAAVAPPCE